MQPRSCAAPSVRSLGRTRRRNGRGGIPAVRSPSPLPDITRRAISVALRATSVPANVLVRNRPGSVVCVDWLLAPGAPRAHGRGGPVWSLKVSAICLLRSCGALRTSPFAAAGLGRRRRRRRPFFSLVGRGLRGEDCELSVALAGLGGLHSPARTQRAFLFGVPCHRGA